MIPLAIGNSQKKTSGHIIHTPPNEHRVNRMLAKKIFSADETKLSHEC